MHIHLACSAEDDSVLVDDVNLPLRLDRSQDLGGRSRWVENSINRDPLLPICAAGGLVEPEGCISADVERLPGQRRLLARLLHGDRCLAASR